MSDNACYQQLALSLEISPLIAPAQRLDSPSSDTLRPVLYLNNVVNRAGSRGR
jgi:hypothetical protein